MKCKTLIVTEKRTILQLGLLSRRTVDVRHKDVRLVEVSQSIFQRIFGTGNLAISSAGHGGVEIEMPGIIEPQKLKRQIDALRD